MESESGSEGSNSAKRSPSNISLTLQNTISQEREPKRSPAKKKLSWDETVEVKNTNQIDAAAKTDDSQRNLNQKPVKSSFIRSYTSPPVLTQNDVAKTGLILNTVQDELEDLQEELERERRINQTLREELRQLKMLRLEDATAENDTDEMDEEMLEMERMRQTRDKLASENERAAQSPSVKNATLSPGETSDRSRGSFVVEDNPVIYDFTPPSRSPLYQAKSPTGETFTFTDDVECEDNVYINDKPRFSPRSQFKKHGRIPSLFLKDTSSLDLKREAASSINTEVLRLEDLDIDGVADLPDEISSVPEYPARSNTSFLLEALADQKILGINLLIVVGIISFLLSIWFWEWLFWITILAFGKHLLSNYAFLSPLWNENLGPHLPCEWGKGLWLETDRGYRIHIFETQGAPQRSRCNVLFVHDLGHCSLGLSRICRQFRRRMKANIYAMDLQGHGLSGGQRGVFEFSNWIRDVCDASRYLYLKDRKQKLKCPTVVIGVGIGADVAVRACLSSHYIGGIVCSGYGQLHYLRSLPGLNWLQSKYVDVIEMFLRNWVKIPLDFIIDSTKLLGTDAPDCDPRHYMRWLRNPLSVFGFGFQSLRSLIVTYDSHLKDSFVNKPILVLCAEDHEFVDPTQVKDFFKSIPGKLKRFLCIPHGRSHDLVLFTPPVMSVIESYISHFIVSNKGEGWTSPIRDAFSTDQPDEDLGLAETDSEVQI